MTALVLAWFQEHSGLTPTGVFDDRTRAEMPKSRCGLMRAPVLRATGAPLYDALNGNAPGTRTASRWHRPAARGRNRHAA
ncbi:peptidoglycan-binding protein [Streptomyces sp. CB02980]|nr:peptidoglycan-binding protein [Streptomyces sp. CB02980]